ncbi:hypothetical protein CORMATOL_00879 [Corynebacterium matruchotii ATCC 33806]|uniref:Uncharacterized protein n=1 Tax=Corynebacterium matruchotii ATCC 33806 TaxID=566549 RepID=C0E1M8_9CORY|nr:hypothetical protein CORMATOL_00879 [Corynebacterium matruchotii ATCC 33806]
MNRANPAKLVSYPHVPMADGPPGLCMTVENLAAHGLYTE